MQTSKVLMALMTAVTVSLSSCVSVNEKQPSAISDHQSIDISGIKSDFSGEQYTVHCDAVLKQAYEQFTIMEKDTSVATLDSVMGKYDELSKGLQKIDQTSYLKSVHPDAGLRESAIKCSEKYSEFYSRVGMSRLFYDRLAAIDLSEVSEDEKFMVKTSLQNFIRAGVNKDEPTREKIRGLRKEISVIGNKFSKNIQQDVRSVKTTLAGLNGLPNDYIKSHPADEQGFITITTNYPDYSPVMKYAEDDDLRYRLRKAFRSRAYPENENILKELLTKRYELAQLLGFDNWAEYSMSNKMIGSPQQARDFLNTVGKALKEPVKNELEVELTQLQQIKPDAEIVQIWQVGYVDNLIRQQQYDLDAKEVREYFSYQNVRDGIFKLTGSLFDVEIRPWKTQIWHDDVEAYEILEQGELLGRFYLDSHPREGKYKHAAHFTLRSGIKGQQIPLSALAQNFPRGLMEHGQVETFLHEFGHLLHNMFAGKQKWLGQSGMGVERDFVEAPSQMLEEWVWDYDTLKTFAKNQQGEVIPKTLVVKMNRARDFGKATSTASQLYLANLSLSLYDRNPDSLDLMTITKKLSAEFSPYPFMEGSCLYCNFGHLRGYTSNYYMYQWSLAIATEMFSKFQQEGLHNAQVAREYREKVLAPGSSKPARLTVTDFLGREFSTEAYIASLKEN